MSESFEYREVTHFATGSLGEPGNRTFFLQVGNDHGYISVKLEKQQVEALAQFLTSILEDLPATPQSTEIFELKEPAVIEWVVGQIAVGVDESDGEIVLLVEERPESADETLVDDGAQLRAHITTLQAAQFVKTAQRAIKGGRPPCRLCGQPMDPSGHTCPRLN